MTKRMLIDATHEEETRVVLVGGTRLIDFDYESKVRKQLKGSIFLAKVTRVEPSLQAAFVNFGGNRHGFLPFSEIHPDYFRIPISDRKALLAEQDAEMEARQAEEETAEANEEENTNKENNDSVEDEEEGNEVEEVGGGTITEEDESDGDYTESDDADGNVSKTQDKAATKQAKGKEDSGHGKSGNRRGRGGRNHGRGGRRAASHNRSVELVGGDGVDGDRPVRPSLRRNYKIQEVVKRGQIMLIQVSREERGNKGAAVTTYMSLPGRYCVLMPNSPRGGGVSRKIDSYKDRQRMREILSELKVPTGMSVIMRTAGVERTKAEIKRDLDYLMRLWDTSRELTLKSTAPALIHGEGNLIRRAIRDVYTRDVEEVLVAGEKGYKMARDFMKMMIPSHAKRVKEYKDEEIPLFLRYQMEAQINAIGDPAVVLKSGGYLVINPTEALVSIDVNSGRATKGRHIEETALHTNMEAAEEVARQLRLRDLGGLVVVDFIDMEERRNNRKVENCLKNALSVDRARIQMGRISSFGLLELSRQRLNPSVTEAQFERCEHCEGVGYVRTVDSAVIVALRALEEEGSRHRSTEVTLALPNVLAIYLLNQKRDMLAEIEHRYGFKILIHVDDTLMAAGYRIETPKGAVRPSRAAAGDNKEEEKKDDSRPSHNQRGTRRRGRRGGRRHSQHSNMGDNKHQQVSSEESREEKPAVTVSDTAKDTAKDTATDDKKVKKEKEKPAQKRKSSQNVQKEDKAEEKSKKKITDSKSKTKKEPEKTSDKSDKKDKKDKKKTADINSPSNDLAAPPARKKKGWWSSSKAGD